MEVALIALIALACPVGMGLMMFFMMKWMRRGDRAQAHQTTPPQDVDQLRVEHARLGAEIERLDGGPTNDRQPASTTER